MDAVDQMLKAALKISPQIVKVNEIALKQSTGKMIDLNHNQLDRGQLNTGQSITPSYAASTRRKKGRSIPDLFDKGDFRNKFFIDVKRDSLNFDSSDFKTDKLTDKYSKDIFGLTDSNAEQLFNDEIYSKDVAFINKVVEKHF